MQTIKMPRILFLVFPASILFAVPATSFTQASAPLPKAPADSQSSTDFDVATIKPSPPRGGPLGPTCYSSGKVEIGEEPLMVLLAYAMDMQVFQISGGPDWVRTDRYDLTAQPAAPPRDAASLPAVSYELNADQQLALQKLLVERFSLKFHIEKKEGPVYILSRGNGPLTMQPAKDRTKPRGAWVLRKVDRIDGEALGVNATTGILAKSISADLERPVIDQTGLTDSYDFRLPPFDATNNDMTLAVFKDMERLGLKLKSGKGPVETVVIDSVQRPSPN